MLVLLSFVLVLVATVLLVLGLLVSDGLTLIYISIGMSALAAVLLVIAVRMSKPSTVGAAAPTPLEPEPEPVGELVGVGAVPAAAVAASPAPAPVAPPVIADATSSFPVVAAEDGDDWLASGDEWGSADVEFPIADYDDLTVDEVLSLLPQLYSDELDVVEAREKQGLNRTPVLDRLAELRVTGTEADLEVDELEPVVVPPAEHVGPALAISNYDELAVSEIVGVLGGLDAAELTEIRDHEAANKNRRTVISAIGRRLGAAVPEEPPAPVIARTPAKKAAAKKAAAKKAAAKKAAPIATKAAPAKAAPATKAAPAKAAAPTKKAAAKAAAPVTKAATKASAPVTKAAAKKAAPPAKKVAATKAAPAKKAAAKKR